MIKIIYRLKIPSECLSSKLELLKFDLGNLLSKFSKIIYKNKVLQLTNAGTYRKIPERNATVHSERDRDRYRECERRGRGRNDWWKLLVKQGSMEIQSIVASSCA